MGDSVIFFHILSVFPGLRGFCIPYHPREISNLASFCVNLASISLLSFVGEVEICQCTWFSWSNTIGTEMIAK